MRSPRLRIRIIIRTTMTAIAVAACIAGTAIAISIKPHTPARELAGLAACYGIPMVLILGRGVPLKRVVKFSGRIILWGSPIAVLFGLLCGAMSGLVGLVGGGGPMMLIVVWGALLAAATLHEELEILSPL